MKIICFHILNDFSGSPKVLEMVLSGLQSKGHSIDVITSKGAGALDSLKKEKNISFHLFHYNFSRIFFWNLLQFLYVQIYIFFYAFRYLQKDCIFYINTIMPVGAAFAGKIMGKKIVYHYHENAATKSRFYVFLAWIMQKIATEIICVSDYQRKFLKRKKHIYTIPNSLSKTFENQCLKFREKERDKNTVLMLSSLKVYKGTIEFIQLAQELPCYSFELVINDTWDSIRFFFKTHAIKLPHNIQIWDRQSLIYPFYERASLVLNLSNKELVVETFGMTVLEAMTAGVPVIVPTVGGIADLVQNGINGYKIDVQNLDCIKNKIIEILSNKKLHKELSQNAIRLSQNYSYSKMINNIESILLMEETNR